MHERTMKTLGINAAFHDSAACLVADGAVVAAAEEERFTQIKHGKRPVPFSAWELPYHAIDYCLAEAGVTIDAIDHVAYSFAPGLMVNGSGLPPRISLPLEPSAIRVANGAAPWDALFLSYVVNAPRQLAGGAPHHLECRLRSALTNPPWQWHYVPHHLAHQASAFLAAPFDDCAVLTLDGRGENASTQYGTFRGGRYERLAEVPLPHSLGLLYEDVTRHLGFLHSSDEYKVMALASFGTPRFVDEMRGHVRWQGDGRYIVDAPPFARWSPPRSRGDPFLPVHADIAYAAQRVLEQTVLDIARWLRETTGLPDLAMAGGVALNCVMNGFLRDQGVFDRIWVQPAAGDAGTALGAALWIDREARGGATSARAFRMEHAYLGPAYSETDIEAALRHARAPHVRPDNLTDVIADRLAEDRIVGWFQGRMEFGPRALGSRSILASPLHAGMQARLNELKDREDFRPVAPAVLEEAAPDWFEDCTQSPFMLFVHRVAPERRARIPAACHADGTARVQTVSRVHNPLYHDVIGAFAKRTGVPVVINTSFNTRGKPIVCTPRDALECFFTSPLDVLAIGPYVVEKAAS
jgi:carbamoyltransferase